MVEQAAKKSEQFVKRGNSDPQVSVDGGSWVNPLAAETVAEACVMSLLDTDVEGVQEIPMIQALSQRLRERQACV